MTGRKFDSEKEQYTLIPPFALREIARNLTFGARKYEPENWKKVPNAKKRYLDALFRHVEAYRLGEVNDPENGLHHLAAAAVNLMFVMEFELAGIPEVKDGATNSDSALIVRETSNDGLPPDEDWFSQ